MKKLLFFITLLLSFPTQAQTFLGSNCSGGGALCSPVPLTPSVNYNFLSGSLPTGLTFTRATIGYYFSSSGFLTSASVNTPRFDYGYPGSSTLVGLLLEPASTNYVLNDRDLTQTNWTLTNATASKTATGIDGVANSATTLTATAASASACQPITLASSCVVSTLYLKRITGTGSISISSNNNTNTTSTTLTTSWQRFVVGPLSLTNPTICVNVSTNGDVIGVDVAQVESNVGGSGTNCFGTSPLPTTSSTVARSADVMSSPVTSPYFNPNSGASVFSWAQYTLYGTNPNFFGFNNNGNLQFGVNNGYPQVVGSNCGSLLTGPTNTNYAGYSYGSSFFEGTMNGTVCSRSTSNPTSTPASVGYIAGAIWVKSFQYWNYPLTAAQLAVLAP
jgi:hypothetical protein